LDYAVEHAQNRLEKGKQVHKKFEIFTKNVPTLVFSNIICTENAADVLRLDSLPPASFNVTAHMDKILEAIQAESDTLSELYQAPDGTDEDLPLLHESSSR
jgi:hypothetical protein